jgi:hypothetical protein
MKNLFSQELGARIAEIIKIPDLNVSNADLVARAALDRPTKLGDDNFRSAFLKILNTSFLEELKEAKNINQLVITIQKIDAEMFSQFDEATRLGLRNTFRSVITATKTMDFADQRKVEDSFGKPRKAEISYSGSRQPSNKILGDAINPANSGHSLGKPDKILAKQRPRGAGPVMGIVAIATLIIGFIGGLANSNYLAFMLIAAWIGGPVYVYRQLKSTKGGIAIFGLTALAALVALICTVLGGGIAYAVSGKS